MGLGGREREGERERERDNGGKRDRRVGRAKGKEKERERGVVWRGGKEPLQGQPKATSVHSALWRRPFFSGLQQLSLSHSHVRREEGSERDSGFVVFPSVTYCFLCVMGE